MKKYLSIILTVAILAAVCACAASGGTYDTIRALEPDATVLEGLPISGGRAGNDAAQTAIKNWLDGLEIE